MPSMRTGIAVARWFAREAERVYGWWNESDEKHAQRQLAEWVQSRGGAATVRELCRGPRKYRDRVDAETALNGLVASGWGLWEPKVGGTTGAPTKRFRLYPQDSTHGGDGDTMAAGGVMSGGSVTVAANTSAPPAGAKDGEEVEFWER